MNIKKYFDNNYALYITLGIAIINILGYLTVGSFTCVIIFIFICYVSHRLINILAVDILIGLLITNITFSCGGIKESLL